MTPTRGLWVLGAYLAGTFPSTFVISKLTGARAVLRESKRDVSEADAHVVMGKHLGGAWAALAATIDVAKGLTMALAARRFGHLPTGWVALVGVAVVVGHSFPFYAREMSGRGLAATAGVFLALIPVEMVVAGVIMVVGIALKNSGVASTIGFGSAPLVAALQGQPPAFVGMAAAIVAVILIRRLQGAGRVARASGLSLPRAALYRAIFDSSGPPSRRVVPAPSQRRA